MRESEFLRTNKPTSSEYHSLAPYPRQTTEFEIQAWLFMKLLDVGFDVRGETAAQLPSGKRCYFDLLVFDEDQRLQYIIEIKTFRAMRKRSSHERSQRDNYCRFGVPVHYVYGMEGAFELRDKLMKWRAMDATVKAKGKTIYTPLLPDDWDLIDAWKRRDKKH